MRDYFDSPSPPPDSSRKLIYSNLGVGLLGYALEKASNQSLEELIVDRVCKPLGMESTSFSTEPTAQGHDADGNPAAPWEKGDSVPAGAFALKSTCHDMLAFAKAILDLDGGDSLSLKVAFKTTLQPCGRSNTLESTGLGWRLNNFGVISTSGKTSRFRCAMFLYPASKTAVVTMANTQVGGVTGGRVAVLDTIAGSLLNVSLGQPAIATGMSTPLKLGTPSLDDFVGSYRAVDSNQGPSFVIRTENEKLFTKDPGNMDFRLRQSGKDSFFLRSYIADFSFMRDETGMVSELEVIFEGNHTRLSRSAE